MAVTPSWDGWGWARPQRGRDGRPHKGRPRLPFSPLPSSRPQVGGLARLHFEKPDSENISSPLDPMLLLFQDTCPGFHETASPPCLSPAPHRFLQTREEVGK